jgi:hypothetical protein
MGNCRCDLLLPHYQKRLYEGILFFDYKDDIFMRDRILHKFDRLENIYY